MFPIAYSAMLENLLLNSRSPIFVISNIIWVILEKSLILISKIYLYFEIYY